MRLRGGFRERDKENKARAVKHPGQAEFSGGCSADFGGDLTGLRKWS